LYRRFIQELGKALGLRHDTMATAAVYFHRFYMFHNFIEFPRYVSNVIFSLFSNTVACGDKYGKA
jgi:hypothetical protein